MISDSAILKKIEQQPKRTAGFKQLVRELGLHGDERRELDERLQASGLQRTTDATRFRSLRSPQAASGRNMIVGRLSMHRDGFGFVIPDPASLDARLKASLAGDIFIPPPAIGSAMHGDRVLVEIARDSAGRPSRRADHSPGGSRATRPLWVSFTTELATTTSPPSTKRSRRKS